MLGNRGSRSGEVEAFLGKNTVFEGKLTFNGMVRLDGEFDGEVFSEDLLIVGENAAINAEINVGTIVINGKVSGNLSVTDKIEIHSTGKLYGNINTPSLVIKEGGLFNGSCKMDSGVQRPEDKVIPLKEKEAKGKKILDSQDEV